MEFDLAKGWVDYFNFMVREWLRNLFNFQYTSTAHTTHRTTIMGLVKISRNDCRRGCMYMYICFHVHAWGLHIFLCTTQLLVPETQTFTRFFLHFISLLNFLCYILRFNDLWCGTNEKTQYEFRWYYSPHFCFKSIHPHFYFPDNKLTLMSC